MKPLTFVIALLHTVYVVSFMWLGPYILVAKNKSNTRLVFLWLLLSLAMMAHWHLPCMKQECVVSLLEKKTEDPGYVTGSEPNKSYLWTLLNQATGVSIPCLFSFHLLVSKIAFLFAVTSVTLQNKRLKHKEILYVVLTALTLQYIY